MTIALTFKRNCHSGCIAYAFLASKGRKHKTSTYIKPELSPTFSQSQVCPDPKSPLRLATQHLPLAGYATESYGSCDRWLQKKLDNSRSIAVLKYLQMQQPELDPFFF